jgi:ribosomal protein L36
MESCQVVKREGTGMAPRASDLRSPCLLPWFTLYWQKRWGAEVIYDMSTKGMKPDWAKFHAWERRYTSEKLKKLTPVERVKIVEDLYITALKVRESLKKLNSQ